MQKSPSDSPVRSRIGRMIAAPMLPREKNPSEMRKKIIRGVRRAPAGKIRICANIQVWILAIAHVIALGGLSSLYRSTTRVALVVTARCARDHG